MRLIFYIIVAYVVYKIAKSLFPPMKVRARRVDPMPGSGEGESGDVPARETVLDSVCGSYIAKDLAIKIKKGGKTSYFCGDECRDKFTSDDIG